MDSIRIVILQEYSGTLKISNSGKKYISRVQNEKIDRSFSRYKTEKEDVRKKIIKPR
jgi:hypothetical protein